MENFEPEIRSILEKIEGRPLKNNLVGTPGRFQRAMEELLSGYSIDLDGLFVTEEDQGQDQLVIVRNIGFTSLCRHHLLSFSGYAHVGYLPKDRVIGVSKVVRLVLAYAHRLQLQEQLTKMIAYSLMERLQPLGVAVVTIAEHSCIRCRGVRSSQSQVVVSEMLGAFRVNPELRREFLILTGLGEFR